MLGLSVSMRRKRVIVSICSNVVRHAFLHSELNLSVYEISLTLVKVVA